MGRHWDGPLLDVASQAAGIDLRRVLHRGAPGLERSDVLQTAIVTLGLMALEPLHGRFSLAAGHSLGELTARAALGAWSPEQAVRLAARRGRAMGEAAAARPGRMFQVDGTAVDRALATPGVSVASINPDGWVLSADESAAISVPHRPIPSLGAWHHDSMKPAIDALSRALRDHPPVDVTGFVPDEPAAERLCAQLTETCDWRGTLNQLGAMGVTDAIVPPPGRIVAQHLRAALPDVRIHLIRHPDDVHQTLEALS